MIEELAKSGRLSNYYLYSETSQKSRSEALNQFLTLMEVVEVKDGQYDKDVFNLDIFEVVGDKYEGVVHVVPAELRHNLLSEVLEPLIYTLLQALCCYPVKHRLAFLNPEKDCHLCHTRAVSLKTLSRPPDPATGLAIRTCVVLLRHLFNRKLALRSVKEDRVSPFLCS